MRLRGYQSSGFAAMISQSMSPACSGDDEPNCYALVTYVPEPLGSFLNRLRKELEPNGNGPRAHVTLLPPRPVQGTGEEALRLIETLYSSLPIFTISIGDVRIFPVSNVVYLEIVSGREMLNVLHQFLNCNILTFKEAFPYHPHLTIAQNLTREESEVIAGKVQERWQSWQGERSFKVESVAFVRNTSGNRWTDLGEFHLAPAVPVP